MISLAIEGTTRRIGKSQGYNGLCVRDFVYADGTPAMQTRWQPTPAELAALASGAPITVTLLGSAHPPILITVEPEIREDRP
ncbi:hypothetical protein [Frigidibacter sp. MR17.24]|uniref:hypothetical protein n=1 Tax=Frigidibacter sp. MR17.24 TaxID=3127345 RepID=UPI003012A28A